MDTPLVLVSDWNAIDGAGSCCGLTGFDNLQTVRLSEITPCWRNTGIGQELIDDAGWKMLVWYKR